MGLAKVLLSGLEFSLILHFEMNMDSPLFGFGRVDTSMRWFFEIVLVWNAAGICTKFKL